MRVVMVLLLGLLVLLGALICFGVERDPLLDELPLTGAGLDLISQEMVRLDAVWAVLDERTGSWILQDRERRELGRVELVKKD